MQIKLPFDATKPITGEASVEINKSAEDVFSFVAKNFFINYPKWAADVIELEPLDGGEVFIGAKAKQVREDNGEVVESIFEITDYRPTCNLIFQGITAPYKHTYLVECEPAGNATRLTFKFDLLDIDFFMRPFEKLIRIAIEEGAENTVENIKNLITHDCN